MIGDTSHTTSCLPNQKKTDFDFSFLVKELNLVAYIFIIQKKQTPHTHFNVII